MAVLPDLPGIEVTVCVDGEPLEEYDNDDDEIETDPVPDNGGRNNDDSGSNDAFNVHEQDDIDVDWNEVKEYRAARTVSKYVASTTGKEFSIELSVAPPYEMDCEALWFFVEVDGHCVDIPILMKSQYDAAKRRGVTWKDKVLGVEVDRNNDKKRSITKAFKFAAVGAKDANDRLENVKEDAKRMSQVGRIQVLVSRRTGMTLSNDQTTRKSSKLEESVITDVHEKALKGSAKSHGTVLGAVIEQDASHFWNSKPLDPHHPLSIYVLKYRSREALKSLLVLPRTPDPEDSPTHDIDIDNLTKAQKAQVKAFMRGLVTGEGSSGVKRENPGPSNSRRDKKPRTADQGKDKVKEVYDLTGDSD